MLDSVSEIRVSDGWLLVILMFLPTFVLFFWGEYRDKRRRERARMARAQISEEFFEKMADLDRRLDEKRGQEKRD